MLIVHDKRLPEEYIHALDEKVPLATWLPFGGPDDLASLKVYGSILCHPDIYFFELDKRTLIHAPGVPEEMLRALKRHGVELIKGQKIPHGHYPDTIPYNAVRIGKTVFHNLRHTDPAILEKIRANGFRAVDIEQGYSRCSVVVVNEEAFITADEGIAETVNSVHTKNGTKFDILTVSPVEVLLPGEKSGFVGGASGKAPDGTVIFLGDIDLHPDASKIKDFLAKHDTRYVDLKGLPLYDAGGLIILT